MMLLDIHITNFDIFLLILFVAGLPLLAILTLVFTMSTFARQDAKWYKSALYCAGALFFLCLCAVSMQLVNGGGSENKIFNWTLFLLLFSMGVIGLLLTNRDRFRTKVDETNYPKSEVMVTTGSPLEKKLRRIVSLLIASISLQIISSFLLNVIPYEWVKYLYYISNLLLATVPFFMASIFETKKIKTGLLVIGWLALLQAVWAILRQEMGLF